MAAALTAPMVIAAAAVAPAAPVAAAEEAPVARVIVVDTQAILSQAQAAKDVSAQIESIRDAVRKKYEDVQADLQAQGRELDRQSSVVDDEAYKRKRAAFEERVREVQTQIQTDQSQVQAALQQAMGQLQRGLEPVLRDLMEERNANLLLDKGRILVGQEAMDVTEEAVRRLDAALPSVKVQYPPN